MNTVAIGRRVGEDRADSSEAGLTTAILIPGNMCDRRLWSGGGERLRQRLTATGFVVVDADTTIDATIAGIAARLLAATAGRLVLIGFSMGGIVALDAARQAPERIAGLVLADTNAGADLPERAAVRPTQQARVRGGGLARIVADELKPTYLAAAHRGDQALKSLLLDMALALGAPVFCRQSEALRTRADAGPVLDAFAGPVLLIAGAEDALCPPSWHEAMAGRARRATLHIVAGAGHMTPLEQPAAFAAIVADWINANPELLPCPS